MQVLKRTQNLGLQSHIKIFKTEEKIIQEIFKKWHFRKRGNV